MSQTTYKIENLPLKKRLRFRMKYAKSGRSQCRKCKENIKADAMRIAVVSSGKEGYDVTRYYHVECFSLPTKYRRGSSKMSVEDFVKDILEDLTGGKILPSQTDAIVSGIETTEVGSQEKKDPHSPLAAIKAQYEKEKSGKERESKKAKSTLAAQVEAYDYYKDCKSDELKDVLGWNRQNKQGLKELLLFKVIDGHVHGRLALCPICTGVLKVDDSMTKVVCVGRFNEDSNIRIPCTNEYSLEDAPRWKPWYSVEPSEEEANEMDKKLEETVDKPAADEDIQALRKAASKIEWNLTGKAGVRKATAELTEVLQNHEKKLDLPDDEGAARQRVGMIVMSHRDKTLDEIIPILIEQLGFKDEKAAVAAKNEEMMEDAAKNPANASVIAAIKELSDLYFKEGNRNVGSIYAKATKALCDVEFKITKDNAKSLGSGKNKMPNIGKGTADKIYEFVSTGKMEKLEEKRATSGGY